MKLPPTYYQVIADFGTGFGIGNAGDPTISFDDACDTYADQMERFHDSVVFRVEPPNGTDAGCMIDVTDDANLRIAARIRARPGYPEMPEWLEEAS